MAVTETLQGDLAAWNLSSRVPSLQETRPSLARAEAAGLPATGAEERLDLDLKRRSVTRAGQSVALTAKEFLLFELLHTSRGRLFTREDILERVWGLGFLGESRIVDTYVKRLRSKLGAGAVETVRGLGYRCPLPDTDAPLRLLPPEARLLTRLAERILRVTDPAQIIAGVYSLLAEQYAVREVSLWTPLPTEYGDPTQPTALAQPGLPTLLTYAGSGPVTPLPTNPSRLGGVLRANDPEAHPGLLLVPLGTGGASEEPWALLAFRGGSGRYGWSPETRSTLEAVARLVQPALRLNEEISRRKQAEQKMRRLNADLESRVQARTQALAQANADLSALYALAQELSEAGSVQEVLAHGLSTLARIAGAEVCSLWRLQSTELHCLGAYTPDHADLTGKLSGEACLLASLLLQSVACSPAQGVLTRTATLPAGTDGAPGREVLLIPLATALSEVYALHFELPGPVPDDLSLMDAAARAFGLAFERQLQTRMLEQVALNDELTGLPNRRALLTDLGAELSYSQRHRTSLTLSVFEIADIQTVNRQHGFAAGNDQIRRLADDLRSALRLEDRIYRLGGAVLATLVRTVDLQERRALELRLDRFRVGATTTYGEAASLKIGHASSPDEGTTLSDLLHLALTRLESVSEPPTVVFP